MVCIQQVCPHASRCSKHPPRSLCQLETTPKRSGLRQHQSVVSYDSGLVGLSWVVLLVLHGVIHEAGPSGGSGRLEGVAGFPSQLWALGATCPLGLCPARWLMGR